MKNSRLIHLCQRILFWNELATDLRRSHIEALQTIKRTDIDIYRDIIRKKAGKIGDTYHFCLDRLKTAKNELRFELSIEKEWEETT